MSNLIVHLKDVPTHVWLMLLFLVLLGGYYIRPDEVTHDLLKADFGALLLSLTNGSIHPPTPPPNPITP